MSYEKATRAVLKAAARHSVKADTPQALLADCNQELIKLEMLAKMAKSPRWDKPTATRMADGIVLACRKLAQRVEALFPMTQDAHNAISSLSHVAHWLQGYVETHRRTTPNGSVMSMADWINSETAYLEGAINYIKRAIIKGGR